MENNDHFIVLLEDTVNLPDGKLNSLGDRVAKIFTAVQDSTDVDVPLLDNKPQGSWAQRTIINPPKDIEFDADVMFELEEQAGWAPSEYHDIVFAALEADPVYGSMQTPIESKNRCIRVTYANDMHVDVVPYVNRDGHGESIINTDDDAWEHNDADGFTAWMRDRDTITNDHMREAVRLLKYLRDHHDWYKETVSIILTTVVGNTITEDNLLSDPDCYANVASTFARIVSDLAAWADSNTTLPATIEAQPGTDFAHRWTAAEYTQFRADINALNVRVQEAIDEEDEGDSIALWQDLFGTGFKLRDDDTTNTKFPSAGAAGAGAAGAAGVDIAPSRTGKVG